MAKPTRRRLAITSLALTLCRNALIDVMVDVEKGNPIDSKKLLGVFEKTSLNNLSKSLKIDEDEMFINWENVLTKEEMNNIM